MFALAWHKSLLAETACASSYMFTHQVDQGKRRTPGNFLQNPIYPPAPRLSNLCASARPARSQARYERPADGNTDMRPLAQLSQEALSAFFALCTLYVSVTICRVEMPLLPISGYADTPDMPEDSELHSVSETRKIIGICLAVSPPSMSADLPLRRQKLPRVPSHGKTCHDIRVGQGFQHVAAQFLRLFEKPSGRLA
ncbi:hypothetical protein K469DRAFT_778664 [Zopfia rhizophila CBS 207.26]|uniref:Uncharacterized protein n=1 Tax=Zopfia rhizophila CBS 207.26 TaxID=1314779 RepID=A0A6A6E530_9PEZI|nr:hypothetical protein K469DRAFT_778664 [Zopfia rhizophila CBS 207.26]